MKVSLVKGRISTEHRRASSPSFSWRIVLALLTYSRPRYKTVGGGKHSLSFPQYLLDFRNSPLVWLRPQISLLFPLDQHWCITSWRNYLSSTTRHTIVSNFAMRVGYVVLPPENCTAFLSSKLVTIVTTSASLGITGRLFVSILSISLLITALSRIFWVTKFGTTTINVSALCPPIST